MGKDGGTGMKFNARKCEYVVMTRMEKREGAGVVLAGKEKKRVGRIKYL